MNIKEKLHTERNHAPSTTLTYDRSIQYYEKLTGHNIEELLEIAENEEINNIHWRNTQTRQWILEYREQLYNKYKFCSSSFRGFFVKNYFFSKRIQVA